jgi:hypothetical protein
MLSRTVKPCGPDVSTLTSTDDDASHHAGMVTRKPDHQGEPGVSRNTIARGMPGSFGGPVVTMLVYFFLLYTGPWVQAVHPAFPAPCWASFWQNPDQIAPRECSCLNS